jgi:hypothetical protein
MTVRVRAASIAPDLRFPAVAALTNPVGIVLVSGVALRAEGCLPQSLAIPRYLRYADRDAVIVAEGVDWLSELESCLGGQIRVAGERGAPSELDAAVIALDSVDRCFRDLGLWAGNIYLAGADTLAVVLDLVRDAGPVRWEPETLLRELAALELAYLFPVAGKFRSGEYDGQVQYRLNGWGRALAARLTAGRADAARASAYREKIAEILASDRSRYSSFLSGLDVARQGYRTNRLADALALPIPVLV